MTINSFSSLNLKPELLANIESLGYTEMTPIQAQGLPVLLEGKDLLAQAKTGSGKTAAFGIGLLNALEVQNYQTQALVICPTRELADQVSVEIRRLARAIPNIKILTLCGGKPMAAQTASLERAPHIAVGTPGRLLKHLRKGSINFDGLKTLVLDEADRMLDMGFLEDIMAITDNMTRNRQTLLFSATYPEGIKHISGIVQRDPVDLRVESSHHNLQITQHFYQVNHNDKTDTLIALLKHHKPESTLIFCNQKATCKELAEDLWDAGFHAITLHGDLEQFDRDEVLVQFSNNSSSVLIATDVAARGLDIKELAAVVNYDLTPDPEIHVHRIGRTGRAGEAGLALSLFMKGEQSRVDTIEEYQGSAVEVKPAPEFDYDNTKVLPPMITLFINAGRKDKVRPGDVLGALTANTDLPGKSVGKINIFDKITYVAIERQAAKQALKILTEGKIKGRKFRARALR